MEGFFCVSWFRKTQVLKFYLTFVKQIRWKQYESKSVT